MKGYRRSSNAQMKSLDIAHLIELDAARAQLLATAK